MRKDLIKAANASERQNYGTPWWLYLWLDWSLHFTRDLAAEKWNAKHPTFWTEADNALCRPWREEIGYLNCEYRQIVRFMRHAKTQAMAGGVVCSLVATRTDTDWYADAVERGAGQLVDSYLVPETRVWWTVWADVVVGVHHVDGKLEFDLPPGTLDEKTGKPKEQNPSFFPSTLIILAARERHRLVELPRWRRPEPYAGQDMHPGFRVKEKRAKRADLKKAIGLPPLTYGMPEP